MVSLRMTTPRLLVLRTLLTDPDQERYGLDLAHQAGIEPGTIYPILVAFENAGWLESRAEDIDVHAEGRPRRRYYKLTPDGTAAARQALSRRKAFRASERLAW
jgi:DNA-binding PadR family transcriptional regulator